MGGWGIGILPSPSPSYDCVGNDISNKIWGKKFINSIITIAVAEFIIAVRTNTNCCKNQ